MLYTKGLFSQKKILKKKKQTYIVISSMRWKLRFNNNIYSSFMNT